MPYFYDLGYWTSEDCPNVTLVHDDLYTQEEFFQMIADVSVSAADAETARHNARWEKYSALPEYASILKRMAAMGEECCFERLYADILVALKERHGFQALKPHVALEFAGWRDLFAPHRDGQNASDDTGRLADHVQALATNPVLVKLRKRRMDAPTEPTKHTEETE